LEAKTFIYFSGIIGSIAGIVVAVIGYFIVRMVRGYDEQIKKLFERVDELTEEIPAIKTNIEWLKKILDK
jgi:hypothetical protein